MAALEKYEVEFLRELESTLAQWHLDENISLPDPRDSYKLVDYYLSIIKRFLHIELQEVEQIYRARYDSELINFFADYYIPSKLPMFVAFLVHLVLEENIGLFFPRVEITHKFFGNWAIGYTRDDEVGTLIEKRVQYSVGRDGWADFYRNAYLNPECKTLGQIVTSGKEPPQVREGQSKKLLAALVGASAATILLTTIVQCAKRLFRIWVPDDNSTQAMFSIGCVPGSVKFYGFCAEKVKDRPGSFSNYRPLYKEHISSELAEVYDRIPIFINFFTAFTNIEDPEVLLLASSEDKSDKVWLVLQHFFWLITQPYYTSQRSTDDILQDFTCTEVIKVVEVDNVFGLKVKHEPDPDLRLLTKKCLEIIAQENVEVHSANIYILDELTRSLN